jgi:glycosyltransferase involved in cell wall biosynthesis
MDYRQHPLVSVIIPTFNRAELIKDTLRSVEAQSYTNWECLVVDDGSTDNTFEVIQEFVNKDGRFKYLTNKRTKGAQGARNTGLFESKGEFIQFLDSDDMIHPEKFLLQLEEFARNSKLDMIYCYEEHFNTIPGDQNVLRNVSLNRKDDIDNFLFDNSFFSIIPPLWKKDSLLRFNLNWDEKLNCYQDWEFTVKALIRGVEYTHLKIVLNYIREHQGIRSADVNELKYERSRIMAAQNIYRELEINQLNNKKRKKHLGYFVNIFITHSLVSKDTNNIRDLDFILKEGLVLLARMSVNSNLKEVLVYLIMPIIFIFPTRTKKILFRIIRRIIYKKHQVPAYTYFTVPSESYRIKKK